MMAISKPTPFLRSSLSLSSSSYSEPLHPVRRASEFDINYPPRYSTLLGPSPRRAPSNPIDDDAILPPGPPAYSTASQQTHSSQPADVSPSADSPLHSSSRSLFPTHHSRNGIHKYHYHINGSKVEPWATLKVYTSSLERQNTPHFTNGDLIRGVVELNLDTPQNINSITLSVSNGNNIRFHICPFSSLFSVVAGPNHQSFLRTRELHFS